MVHWIVARRALRRLATESLKRGLAEAQFQVTGRPGQKDIEFRFNGVQHSVSVPATIDSLDDLPL